MGFFDFLVDDVLSPIGSFIGEGVEAAGRGIDNVVTTGIDVVGEGVDFAIDYVKENPVTSLLTVAAMVGTGGAAPALGGALGRTLLSSVATRATQTTLANVAASVVAKTQLPSVPSLMIGIMGQSVIGNIFRTKVEPKAGSVVYCDLALVAEHSGIYLGNNQIAHMDGSGFIEIVSPRQFLGRLGGVNPAFSIYVSCDDETAVGKTNTVMRAMEQVGNRTKYNAIMNNCHQFTSGCLTGNFGNADRFLWMLKDTARKFIGATCWSIWDIAERD
jgi:hypothetical protein